MRSDTKVYKSSGLTEPTCFFNAHPDLNCYSELPDLAHPIILIKVHRTIFSIMGSIPSEQLFHRLSPVDHLSPRIHVPKLLYFQTSSSPSEITSTLRNGLSNSISALPILAGTVSLMSAAPQKGTLAIQAPFYTASDIFSVRDASTEYEFEAIKKRHFPPDAIDVEEFSKTANENPSRVFLAQAILINGGFVLVFAIHHCVVDETGN